MLPKAVGLGSQSARKLITCVSGGASAPSQRGLPCLVPNVFAGLESFVFCEAQPPTARCRSSDSRTTCCAAATSPTAPDEELASGTHAELLETGTLEVITGPMFAGKTTALLNRIAVHEGVGRRVVAVKSDKDTRYGLSHLKTHSGLSKVCYAISSLSQLKQRWPEEYKNAEVIAVDEAQFFPDLEEFCSAAADEDNKQVIIAGLDGDFRRHRFGQVLDLIPQADSVVKLVAKCSYCEAEGVDRPALFSLRIAADERQEVVGGADKYAAVCRRHYTMLSKVRSSRKVVPS